MTTNNDPSNGTPFALITGASTGLGKAFAKECARKGKNLLLVALPNEGLPELSASLENQFGIKTAWLETDLTQEDSLVKVRDWALGQYRVDLLINNAGMGGTRPFAKASFDYLDKMIKLNVRATGLLTYLFLPELKSHKEAHILNVGSIIGYTPAPYKTFYPASKGFIFNFSRGLHEELKGSGVSVSVLMAGVMPTNPSVVERMKTQGWRARFISVETDYVAKTALGKMYKKRPVIVLGFGNKFSRFLATVLPLSLQMSMMHRIITKELELETGQVSNGKEVIPAPDAAASAMSFEAPLRSE